MGKKKNKQQVQHVTQSMGQMVSRAALAQLAEPIGQMVQRGVNQLGQKLAMKQAENVSVMFTRIVAIEKLLIEKNIVTQEDLQNKVADIEDERDGATKADDLQTGDIARIDVRTKDVKAENYEDGVTKLKVMNTGSGNTMGTEVEAGMIGMKVGETKVVTFADNKLNAEIKLCRVSRPIPPPPPPVALVKDEAPAADTTAETPEVDAAPAVETTEAPATQPQEDSNASTDQVQG